MIKQIPILFSTDMVRAILDGRKTQTRRTVKPMKSQEWLGTETLLKSPSAYPCIIRGEQWAQFRHPFAGTVRNEVIHSEDSPLTCIKCPYGKPGDLLYVREGYYQLGSWREVPNVKTKGGRMKWEFVAADDNISFDVPESFRKGRHHKDPYTVAWHKRLPRFMPKKYARTWLQVEEIRVERLLDISHDDAVQEGIKYVIDKVTGFCGHDYRSGGYNLMTTAPKSFFSLWESINGEGSRKENPWLWVLKFKVVSTTGYQNIKL